LPATFVDECAPFTQQGPISWPAAGSAFSILFRPIHVWVQADAPFCRKLNPHVKGRTEKKSRSGTGSIRYLSGVRRMGWERFRQHKPASALRAFSKNCFPPENTSGKINWVKGRPAYSPMRVLVNAKRAGANRRLASGMVCSVEVNAFDTGTWPADFLIHSRFSLEQEG